MKESEKMNMLIGQMISAIKVGPAGREKEFYKAQFSSVENTAVVTVRDRFLVEDVEFTTSSGRDFKLDAEYDLIFVVRIAFSELDLVNDSCKYSVTQVNDQSELDAGSILCHYGMDVNVGEFVEIRDYLRQESILDEYLKQSGVDDFTDLVKVELESIYY